MSILVMQDYLVYTAEDLENIPQTDLPQLTESLADKIESAALDAVTVKMAYGGIQAQTPPDAVGPVAPSQPRFGAFDPGFLPRPAQFPDPQSGQGQCWRRPGSGACASRCCRPVSASLCLAAGRGAFLEVDGERHASEGGSLHIFDYRQPHAVCNFGEQPRVALVVAVDLLR